MTNRIPSDRQTQGSQNRHLRNPLRVVPRPIWWMALGALIVILIAVPLGLQPFAGWIHQSLGHSDSHQTSDSGGADLWTCPMHPDILLEEPGECPICGMDLVQVESAPEMSDDPHAHSSKGAELWTCGMHPEVIQEEPGTCPICHMDLTPLRQDIAPTASGPAFDAEVDLWTCPMHSTILTEEPGQCPICGMDLIPVASQDQPSSSDVGETRHDAGPVVTIDPTVVQNMNVRVEEARREDVTRNIRTVGNLDYDQERMVSVTTRFGGFIEKVYVNYIGQPIRKGEPLFDVYSPELVQTQQELLSAVDYVERMANADDDNRDRALSLLEASRRRLSYWDITAEQVAEIERTRAVVRTLAIVAPISGVVMKRMDGLEGMAIRPGMEAIHIADLSSLWMTVEVYEDQLLWLDVGSAASVTFDYFPGQEFRGRVRFVEPEVSPQTRTVKLTLELPNRDQRLRVGMYATVEFEPVVERNAVVVPSQAVIRTGERDLVVVALGDGRFAPREVTLGGQTNGHLRIASGLDAGEQVVTSAQFLIDSESNLRAAIQKMIAARTEHQH